MQIFRGIPFIKLQMTLKQQLNVGENMENEMES